MNQPPPGPKKKKKKAECADKSGGLDSQASYFLSSTSHNP